MHACTRPVAVAMVLAAGALSTPFTAHVAAAQALHVAARCQTSRGCAQEQQKPRTSTQSQGAAADMRRLIVRAQAASAPCFTGFTAVRRDLAALAAGGTAHIAALNANALTDQQACLQGSRALGSGVIPRSLQRTPLAGDFVAHLRNALNETAHACADAMQVAVAAQANKAAVADAAVVDFGRSIQQQTADTTAAANDLVRIEAAFRL